MPKFSSHEGSVAEMASQLGTDLTAGLSSPVAADRLREYGPNELATEVVVPAWRRFLSKFQDALVILLLVAAAISLAVWFVEGAESLPYEAVAIVAVVLLNAAMGFIQEGRAEAALAALRTTAAPEATVVRDGRQQRVPAINLVPGDLLILSEGDRISADARLVAVVELQTMEASLTGESLPVPKITGPLPQNAALAERVNTVFAGTTAVYGHARALVTATGMETELGSIAGLLRNTKSQATPLQLDLDRIGKQLGLGVVAIAAIVVATLLLLHGVRDLKSVIQVMMFGVALAVAAAPESLATVVTLVLALGVRRMAGCGAIVRKLSAVESLGSVTVIASDKTGTLTKNEMTVRVIVTATGSADLTGTGYSPEGTLQAAGGKALSEPWHHETEWLLQAASLANNSHLTEQAGVWTIQGDPTEAALLVAAARAGLENAALRVRYPRVAEAPFSSERKLMSTLHHAEASPDEQYVFTKGAAGTLLKLCTHELVGHDPAPLTEARRTAILAQNETLASAALRTLGVAFRRMETAHSASGAAKAEELEHDLIFLGLIGMLDPPRPEARPAVELARAAGIRPMLITGDHPATALAIAVETGIATVGATVMAGPELEAMTDEALEVTVRTVSVFARVAPRHKLRIVSALQKGGATVAMTGDGVNDAPALKAADIGIAMGITGTDVSKEAADLVLTDDNFATIVVAVQEGRAVFDNIRKTVVYLLSSNSGEVLSVFFAVVLAAPLGLNTGHGFTLPLLATQILWINLITDVAPALALGFDPAASDLMQRAPRSRKEGVINGRMLADILMVGLVMTVGTLFVFHRSLPQGIIFARTMAFTTLMLFQLFNALNARAGRGSAFRGMFSNVRLLAAILLSILLQTLVIYLPGLQLAFGTTGLHARDWALTIAVASSVLWVMELAKQLLNSWSQPRGGKAPQPASSSAVRRA